MAKGGESWNTIDRAGTGPTRRTARPFRARASVPDAQIARDLREPDPTAAVKAP